VKLTMSFTPPLYIPVREKNPLTLELL
jgi:hypothetical protein